MSAIITTYGTFGGFERFSEAKTNPISVSPQHCCGVKENEANSIKP
jgi:hypothetical protein